MADTPLHLLFLTYQGDMAGSTQSIRFLAEGLARRGHRVWVGARPESWLAHTLAGGPVRVEPMRFRGKFDCRNAAHIARLARTHRIDIVNAQSAKDRYSAIWARWFFGMKALVVHTRRQMPRSSGNPFQSWFYRRGTAGIIAVSGAVRDALGRLGIPIDHITVVPNGTPSEKYAAVDPATTETLRRRLAPADGAFVIGCVARRKDQHTLIEALAELPPHVEVVLVGIREDAALKRIREDRGLPHRLHYIGEVADPLPWYGLFDLFVLPSRMEGLSQSVMEAMWMGVPVVVTDAGGNRELVQDGVSGLRVPPQDPAALAAAIRRLMGSPEERLRLREAARRCVREDFSIERTVERTEAFFLRLLGRRASGPEGS